MHLTPAWTSWQRAKANRPDRGLSAAARQEQRNGLRAIRSDAMRRQLGERGRLRLRRRHLDWHLGAIEQANGRSNGHGAHAIEQGDFDDDPQR